MTNVYPMPDNSTIDFLGQLGYINNLTDVTGDGGILGIVLLFIIFGVTFLTSKAFSYEKSFSASMFITSISALFIRTLGLISDKTFYISLVLFVISLLLLWRSRDEGF